MRIVLIRAKKEIHSAVRKMRYHSGGWIVRSDVCAGKTEHDAEVRNEGMDKISEGSAISRKAHEKQPESWVRGRTCMRDLTT